MSANGTTWNVLYQQPTSYPSDFNWTYFAHDITSAKSTETRVRFCYTFAGEPIYPDPSFISDARGWSVDDVRIHTLSAGTCNP